MQVDSSNNENINSYKRPGDDGNLYAGPNKYARTDDSASSAGYLSYGGGSAGGLVGGSGGGSDDQSRRTSEECRRGSKKGSSTTRTGQACDRCKVRKIRCDARPGGCSPCLQNNTECKTTDRITGRATSRGHTENLENENASLRMYMVELQQQLREHEIEPRPMPGVPPGYLPATSAPQQQYEPQARSSTADWEGSVVLGEQQGQTQNGPEGRQGSQTSLLPDFKSGCVGDNYLGVSSENNWLSPIKGTSLALFGMEIDLAKFTPAENDLGQSAMSYETFLNNSFGKSRQQMHVPRLPTYEQCKTYAEWYFRSIQAFVPILHKPDFMTLLDRIHHQGYQTNAAETVQVQLVLAIIGYQYSVRNANTQARDESMSRFHYACSFVAELMKGHSLQDVQALTLIAHMMRGFPRPGAAWMFTNMVLGLAMEIGLHRSAKAWKSESPAAAPTEPHTIEMRKRVWWSLLLFHVTLSGRLGRPMPLRLEDFDIEYPEPLSDNLPSDRDLSPWRKCSFRAAILGFKLVALLIQVFSTIYSVKPSSFTGLGTYEASVKRLEKEVDAFQAEIPPELSGGPQTTHESKVMSLYINMTVQEIRLLLHHPALCRTTSPNVTADNLSVCLDASSKMLASAVTVRQFKSLDTTWYMATTFLAAIFTTLFAYTERQDTVTSSELSKLKTDMDSWLEIIGEVGVLLGSGSSLRDSISVIINTALDHLGRHLAEKTAAQAVASVDSPQHSPHQQSGAQQQMGYDPSQGYANGYTNGTHPQDPTRQGYNVNGPYQQQPSQPTETHLQSSHQSGYPSGNHYAFPPAQPTYPADTTISTYDASTTSMYPTPSDDVKPIIRNITPTSQQTPPATFPNTSQQPPPTNHYQQYPQPFHPVYTTDPSPETLSFTTNGPAAWRHFADNMMTSFPTHWGGDPNAAPVMPGVGIMGAEAAHTLDMTHGLMAAVSAGGDGGAGTAAAAAGMTGGQGQANPANRTFPPQIATMATHPEIKSLAMIGCGSMGGGMALLFAEHGLQVSLQDPSEAAMDKILASAKTDGLEARVKKFSNYADLCASLGSPKVFVWSLPHGRVGDSVLEGLMPFLSKGDVLIDAANEHWQNTERRMGKCAVRGIRYVGMGVSGGYQAARRGPSMCPASDGETLDLVLPLLRKVAAKDVDGRPCVGRAGTGGAGHYVKMIHNGIEHGMMSAIAEAWAIMSKGLQMSYDEIADVLDAWNREGELKNTFLIGIGADICRMQDPSRNNERVLSTVADKVVQDFTGEEGTGVWSNTEAIEQHIPAPTLSTAHFLRIASGDRNQRSSINSAFAGSIAAPQPLSTVQDRAAFLEHLRKAVYAACLSAYAQGMAIIAHADRANHFNISYPEVLQIWSAGCIIRADHLVNDLLKPIYKTSQTPPTNPLSSPPVAEELKQLFPSLKHVCLKAVEGDHFVPALSASLEYLKIMTSVELLPASFYEAQLDYFGSHMYDRWNDETGEPVEGKHHYEWKAA
ncbi:hypothetical protein MBLNU230_g3538t1 [Neophaeotheca triangularis]